MISATSTIFQCSTTSVKPKSEIDEIFTIKQTFKFTEGTTYCIKLDLNKIKSEQTYRYLNYLISQ